MMSHEASAVSGQTLQLADGRRLGYNEWGDPEGAPVLYFHGLHSSRLALYQEPAFFAAHHIRFVTVDRPGIGLSDFQAGRTLLDWPDDVAQLADALGMERFAVLSLTGGGPYALVCAAKMSTRLTGVAIVSGSAPLDAPGIILSGPMNTLFTLSRRAPWALWALYATLIPLMRRRPERVHRFISGSYSPPDQRVAARPEIRATQIAMFLEAFRSGYGGEVRELIAESGAWGFRLEDISIPTQVWDGDQNTLIPPSHTEYLARAMPKAQLHICRGEGHLLIVDHMEEIIQGIVRVSVAETAKDERTD